MTAVLRHAGYPEAAALAGAVLFRLIQVWIPVGAGLLLLPDRLQLPKSFALPVRLVAPCVAALTLAGLVMATVIAGGPDIDSNWWAAEDEILLMVAACFALALIWRPAPRRKLAEARGANRSPAQ
jgi:hypothetical protein